MRKKSPHKLIEVYYQNVCGLRTKLEEFSAAVASSSADLIAITETSCNHSIRDAELIPPGYKIIRCDRTDGRKQGGAFLVATPHIDLRSVPIPDDVKIDNQVFELVCAKVFIGDKFLLLCCVIYIPPGSNDTDYLILFNIIEKLYDKYNRRLLVIGDFNLYSASVNTNNYFEYFLTYCEFTQINKIDNSMNRRLDLVLTPAGEELVGVRAAPEPFVRIDRLHPPLEISVTLSACATAAADQRLHWDRDRNDANVSAENPQWNFAKADYPLLYGKLTCIDWSPLWDLDSVEASVSYFYNILNMVFSECVPLKKRHHYFSRLNYPEWYDSEIIREIKLKSKYHRRYKLTKSREDYDSFAKCRARLKTMIRKAHKDHQDRVQNHLIEDPKSFWKYLKSLNKNSSGSKIYKDGVEVEGHQCAAEFAEFFQSVYSAARPKLDVDAAIMEAGARNGAARVHIDQLQLSDVLLALTKLKPKRSAGPDGIPAFVFRDCRMVLAEPLLHIYNLCLAEEAFPDIWKTTRVVPVPKGGAAHSVDGFRPVAVLSTPAKAFDSALQTAIYDQVKAQLTDAQHGFRPGRSTTSNLLCYMRQLTLVVDGGGQVDVAYFDFRKAFDTVDNDVLLKKLAGVGCTPHLLKFLASYLSDRQQYVECAGFRSDSYYVRSGVSQGSNLGPLEFIIMVNDLPEVLGDSSCLLFADDLKMYRSITDVNDCERFQDDIDNVLSWSEANKLNFNLSKCVTITFTRVRQPIYHDYKIGDMSLKRVTEVKDLGVKFTADLQFRDHIVSVCKKAYRNLGFILRRSYGFNNIKAIIALYNALVRSNLECNAVIWAPHEAKYSLMLERIQNKFVRYLYFKKYAVYPFYPLMYPTLFILGMVGYNELRVRRELHLVSYIFKLLRGRLTNSQVLECVCFFVPNRYVWRRRRPRLLAVPRGRTNLFNKGPLAQALLTLNQVADRIDLFSCSLGEFTRIALFVISYT